jgi:CubicO group peptidase (beta-lactamase class C family)
VPTLTDLLARNAFGSGAVALVLHRGRPAARAVLGHTTCQAIHPVTDRTLFDLASLTKPMVAAVILALVEDCLLALDEPIATRLPSFRSPGRDLVTLRHLLTHTSGLPAVVRPSEDPLTLALRRHPGADFEYSCVGFAVAGLLAEAATGSRLPDLLRRKLTGPLGMRDTGYLPSPAWRDRIAATECVQGRDLVHGEVHDETSWALGGVTGNAGIFGTARDVARFGEMLRRGGTPDGVRVLHTSSVAEMTRDQLPSHVDPGYRHGLGLRLNDPAFMGALGARAFGHTGFTGTSLVVDPRRELVVVLLTNRVHPSRELIDLMPLRRKVADWAAALG